MSGALVQLSSGLRTRPALARQLGVLQLDIADPDFRVLARRHAITLRARIAALLARARRDGALRPEIDSGRLARTVLITYNGTLIAWGIGSRRTLANALRDELDAILEPWRTTAAVPEPVFDTLP